MSNFAVNLEWQSKGKSFTYAEYSREYTIKANNKPTLTGTAAPEYKGTEHDYNPEEMLVMALSSCQMLSYLALAANAKIEVLAYEDNADGSLEKHGVSMKFKEVTLRPKITISGESDKEKALALNEKAHHICFIGNSVNFTVKIEPEIVQK